jgi:hypothetical protein
MAGWAVVPNAHVQVWKNNAALASPPVGPPTYDGPGQILTPALKSPSANPWRGRLVLPASAVNLLGSDINAAGTACWLAVVDDATAQVFGYWKIVDLSPASNARVGFAGQFVVPAVFYDFITSV